MESHVETDNVLGSLDSAGGLLVTSDLAHYFIANSYFEHLSYLH